MKGEFCDFLVCFPVRIYPKCICPKILLPICVSENCWLNDIDVDLVFWSRSTLFAQDCLMNSKQCITRSDAAYRSIWSGSTLFVQVYLSSQGKYRKNCPFSGHIYLSTFPIEIDAVWNSMSTTVADAQTEWRNTFMQVFTEQKSYVLYMLTIKYSRLSLSRTPRDHMKYFEISVLRHIRFAELRKTINRTTTFNRMNM